MHGTFSLKAKVGPPEALLVSWLAGELHLVLFLPHNGPIA